MPEPALASTPNALADPTRFGVVDLLQQRPCRAGELAAAFRMSAPAMSRHLRILRSGGLVEESQAPSDGRVRLYRLRPEPFSDLETWAHELRAFWTEQLHAFKRPAETNP